MDLVDDEDKKTFIYKEEDLPSEFFASPAGHHHTLPSTSIGREDIQDAVQDSHLATDARSTFGGSQSASASMSASMHRIVEGVERLVESDTYENSPALPEQHAFTQNVSQQRSSRMFDPSTDSIFCEDNFHQRQTPFAPPGLGPPIPGAAALVRDPSSQSYTSRPALPGIPSIWNTALSPDLAEASSPRTPPGLGQQPAYMMPGSVGAPGHHHQPSQEAIATEILYRQSLLNQAPLHSPLSGPSTMSPWMGAKIGRAHV